MDTAKELRIVLRVKRCRLLGVLAISAGLAVFQPVASFATPIPNTTIIFNDATDTLTVTTTPSGAGAPGTSGSSCVGEICTINVLSPSPGNLFTGLTAPNGDPLNVLEPGSSIISDIVTSSSFTPTGVNLGDFTVTFTSDIDELLGLGLFTSGGSITEDGTVQDAFSFSWVSPANGSTVATATIEFQSDLDSPVGVPEPISLTLFGTGLIGLGALRRRNKAKA